MKTGELRQKTSGELQKELLASLQEQFNLRMQLGSGQTVSGAKVKALRKHIARIKTVMNEKHKEGNA